MLGNQLKKPAKSREIILAVVGMVAMCGFGYTNFFKKFQAEADQFATSLKEVQDNVSAVEQLNKVLKEKRQQALKEAQSSGVEPLPDLTSKDIRLQMIQRYKKQKYQNVSDFFRDISSPAFRSAITIDSLKHDPVRAGAGYFETKFNLTASGDYTQVVSFLKKLEGVSALVGYDTLLLNVGTGEAAGVTLTLSGTFYQLEDENA